MGISLSPALDLNRPNYSYWESHSYESTQTNRLLLLAGKYVQGIEPISHEKPAALPAGGQRPFLPLFLLISSGMLR